MTTKMVKAQAKSDTSRKVRAERRRHVSTETVSVDSKVVVLGIREARENFSHIISSVAAGSSKSVVIGNRGIPAVAVVSYDLAEALQSGDKKRRTAALIVEDLIGGAPPHLKTSAVNELSGLPKSDLDRLARLEALPLGERKLGALRSKMAHPEALDRLVQRSNVAAAINKARAVGLYDTAEDATSVLMGEGGAAG